MKTPCFFTSFFFFFSVVLVVTRVFTDSWITFIQSWEIGGACLQGVASRFPCLPYWPISQPLLFWDQIWLKNNNLFESKTKGMNLQSWTLLTEQWHGISNLNYTCTCSRESTSTQGTIEDTKNWLLKCALSWKTHTQLQAWKVVADHWKEEHLLPVQSRRDFSFLRVLYLPIYHTQSKEVRSTSTSICMTVRSDVVW